MGRVEIPVRKWIAKSSPLVPATYQGFCNNIGDIVKVRGSGVKVRFWTTFGGKVQFTIRHQPLNRLGSRLFCWAHVSI